MKVDHIEHHAVHDYSSENSPIVYWCKTSKKQGEYQLNPDGPRLWCNERELTVTTGGAIML